MEQFHHHFLETSPKRRYRLGTLIAYVGLMNVCISLALGITGVQLYFNYRYLFMIGNPTAGTLFIYALIIEGFVLEFFPALDVAFFGLSITWINTPTVKPNTNFHVKTQGRTKTLLKSDKYEDADDNDHFPKWKSIMESYVSKAPHFLWVTLLLLSVGVNAAMAVTCYVMDGAKVEHGMAEAMRKYTTDGEARRAVDWVQTNGECCGDNSYEEWFKIEWCTMKAENAPPEESLKYSGNMCDDSQKSAKYDVPHSCCTPNRRPCIQDAFDVLGLGPLNFEGCGTYVKDRLHDKYISLMYFHAFFSASQLILLCLVLCMIRLGDSPREKATDEEAANLLPPEDSPPLPPRPPIPPRRPNHLPRPQSSPSLIYKQTTKEDPGRYLTTPPIYAAVSPPRVSGAISATNPEK